MKPKLIFIMLAFFLGIFSTFVFGYYFPVFNSESPDITTTYVINEEQDEDSSFITRIMGSENEELASPYDWITESKIHVLKDKIVIDLDNAHWARFTDTNSMDPVIDKGANAIEIIPENEADIHVGDIVSYESKYADGTIIHRVIDIGYDNKGWYAIMKGDNNSRNDPGKIRFDQIKRVVVAIIY